VCSDEVDSRGATENLLTGCSQPQSGHEVRVRVARARLCSNSGLEQGLWAASIGVSAGLRACIGDGTRVHTITVLSSPRDMQCLFSSSSG